MLVRIVIIFLGVYVLFFEFVDNVDVYIDFVCDIVLFDVVYNNFVDVVDVFCEFIGFIIV